MIPIKNIYYMLSYAFRILQEKDFRKLADEDFENAADLYASILIRSVSMLIRQGLGREYLRTTEPLSGIRGKMDVSDSIKTQSILKKQLVCSYDVFSVNMKLNRIIKSTFLMLLHGDVDKSRKKDIRKLLLYFSEVDPIDLHTVDWHTNYNKQNRAYQLLISICHLVYKSALQSKDGQDRKMQDFGDDQTLPHLYEKFILEYYRKEHPALSASAPHIDWQLDDDFSDHLPLMKTDITLQKGDRTLIIDAKFYTHSMQERFGARTIHSANLYQIFTYVKNKEYELRDVPHAVAGMLLYAKTGEITFPSFDYQMSGNRISAHTLDLNRDFLEIRRQLDGIAKWLD